MTHNDESSSRSYCNGRLTAFLQVLANLGICGQRMLAGTGLTEKELSSCDSIISTAQAIKIYENTIKHTQDPLLAWSLGSRANIASLGVYGFAILSAPTLRVALECAERYSKIISPLIKIDYEESCHGGKLSIRPVEAISYSPLLQRFVMNYHTSALIAVLKELLGSTFTPTRMDCSFPEHDIPDEHKTLLTCPFHYHTPETACYLETKRLNQSNPRGNNVVFSRMLEECNSRMMNLESNVGISGRIRNYFLTTRDNHFSMTEVCDHLALSERTLRRKLREEGTSFREISDGCRRQLALKYLEETHLPVERIASHLGFNSAAGFRQAIHRWTGITPSKTRSNKGEA